MARQNPKSQIDTCSASQNATVRRATSLKTAINSIQKQSQLLDSNASKTSVKSRSQRPLRSLEHNKVLLERKSSPSSQEGRCAQPKAGCLDNPGTSFEPELEQSLREALSSASIKTAPAAGVIDLDSDSDDTLDRINFWTTPGVRDKSLAGRRGKEEPIDTPRGKRAQQRQFKWPKQDNANSLGLPAQFPKKVLQDPKLFPSSRPTSSHSIDPRALLTL
jgi:hypothetical protein